jgi:putative hydrolase of the HAD superfamily
LSVSSIQGVIFDLGSTLIDFQGDYASIFPQSISALYDYLIEQDLALDRDRFVEHFERALREYHTRRDQDNIEQTTFSILSEVLQIVLDHQPEEGILRAGLNEMYAISEAYWEPKPALHKTLATLAREGYRLGLLSNAGDEANVQRLIDKVAIRSYFDPILISAAIGLRKPDPETFRIILRAWKLPESTVIMVGDLLEADILGANRAGIHSIWLHGTDRASVERKPVDPKPGAVASTLAEVPAIIQSWDLKG